MSLSEALTASALRTTLRLLLKPALSPRWTVPRQRAWLEKLSALARLPRGVVCRDEDLAGIRAQRWQDARGQPCREGRVLFLHGGAYCVGSPRTHRALAAWLARDSGLPVVVPDYRLAPEHPFPAALDDALAVYDALIAQGPVVIAGDSAGGGLALALAVQVRDSGRPVPAGVALLSPWVDLRPGQQPADVPGEAMLSADWMQACAGHYAGTATDDPRVSPLLADLRGLPPVLVQCGTDELLHVQSRALADALTAAGVQTTLDVVPHRWHVFQLHAGQLPSANAAVSRIARFALKSLDAIAAPRHAVHDVVILGAGMSGLCMAMQLQKAGRHDFVMLEQQPGLGGTWWDNTYPGAQVDVPAPAYAFSFAPNARWSQRFANAPEIQAYQQALAQQQGLFARLRLGARLSEARFDEATGLWHFRTARGDTLVSRFFVCSTGPLSQPRWPDIPGLDDFQGLRLHSARWDHDKKLAGLRVGVIGTGSTAVQLIPPIAREAAQLHVFQRTANWVLPRLERKYRWFDRLLATFPPYAVAVRAAWVQFLELGRRGFDEGTFMRWMMLKLAARQRRQGIADPGLRATLTPDYPLGCKRIIYSNDYYPALSQPNVALVTAPIARITANGIVTADGTERGIDALVCATGFDTVHLLQSLAIHGRGGRTLSEAWRDGPDAFHGISVAGFPNLFLMLGPNTATGHTSTLLFIEPAADHAIACMREVERGGHRAIEVRADVQQTHNADLQQRLGGSVWAQCRSWYRMDGGKVIAIFPGFVNEYVRAVREPRFADYVLHPGAWPPAG
ncbi:MAG: alpha/beta hydrolase fold domain-containing protein [Arenimonas sp.]|uniref:alpha/beta hydrolase fold domain-containing protein n=1 Tax=Arenimonas sp. TaxID=1872635 RepID=UPI0025C49723|nr:alpha/beta hydrolase fold domain-containing protein [Arenimonas sp.]MBW8367576.1 alpha/beta hydrolase fold domain-containing protein [Arenimonas sp.]